MLTKDTFKTETALYLRSGLKMVNTRGKVWQSKSQVSIPGLLCLPREAHTQ